MTKFFFDCIKREISDNLNERMEQILFPYRKVTTVLVKKKEKGTNYT